MSDLARRISRKLERNLGMQLKPADLDLLVTSGAYAALLAAVEAEQQRISANRMQATSRAEDVPRVVASNDQGMTGRDALLRGLEMTRVRHGER